MSVAVADIIKPPSRIGHIAVACDNYMYIWGGYKNNPDGSCVNFSGTELWIYNSNSKEWGVIKCSLCDLPPATSGATGAIIDSSLYVFGGHASSEKDFSYTNKLFRLDLRTFVWKKLIPSGVYPIPVDKMVGWHYNKKFYIFGGFNSNNITAVNSEFEFEYSKGWTNQFFVYDPEKNHWGKPFFTGALPCPRAAHAVAVLKNKVYIFGGRYGTNRLNDLHCWDMNTMHWSEQIPVKGPVPEGRSWHSLTAVYKRFLILYGGFSHNNVPLSDCWLFDIASNHWQQIQLPFDKPRLWHTACQNICDEVLIFGGYISNILESTGQETADDMVTIKCYS